jgi:hypothetical protein
MCKVGILIRELSDDDDDSNDGIESCASPITPSEPSAPWHKDFFGYLNSTDQLGNMTIVELVGGMCLSYHASFDLLTYSLVQYYPVMTSGYLLHAICSQLWRR